MLGVVSLGLFVWIVSLESLLCFAVCVYGNNLLVYKFCCLIACNSAKHDDVCDCVATDSVATVDAACHFASCKEAFNDFACIV